MKKTLLKIMISLILVLIFAMLMLIYLGAKSIKESPISREEILKLPNCVLNALETENGLVTKNAINLASKKCEKKD